MVFSKRALLWCALAAPISLVGLTGLVDRSSGEVVAEAADPASATVDPAAPAASFSDPQVFARVVVEDCPYPDVCPTNQAPVITTNGGNAITTTMNENVNYAGVNLSTTDDSDSEYDGLTYSVSGPDAATIGVDADAGTVVFTIIPDFENPEDANGDNSYVVTVTVTDSEGATDTIEVTHVVRDVADTNQAPVITTNGGNAITTTMQETAVFSGVDLSTTDDNDSEFSGLIYSVSGPDSALVGVNPDNGVVLFGSGPDFDNPADANGDNIYVVIVTVTDSGGETDTIAIAVQVEAID